MKTYERKSFPRTARDLKVMYEKRNLSFDNAVQRSFVWKNTTKDNRMSMLIDSMMRGLPIPPMYCNCLYEDSKNKLYDFLDGKQRTTTIINFLNDKFPLVNIPTFEEEDGTEIDLNGKIYSQLPEEYRDRVKTYSLTVYYYENMEQEDAEEMFRRLNNGKSLTAIELSRAKAVSRHDIFKLGKHELFNVALTGRALAGHVNEDIIIKTWVTLYCEKKSLEKRNTNPIMETTKISHDQITEMSGLFDLFVEAYKELLSKKEKNIIKKMFNKNNLVSLTSVLKYAKENDVNVDTIIDWIIHFYDTSTKELSINERYNELIKGRIAVTEAAVMAREEILIGDFKEYLDYIQVE